MAKVRPETTATYCLPSMEYVAGAALMPEPVMNFHSVFPFLASSALNQPWMSPWNTSPLAVVVMPPRYGSGSVLPQTFCCLTGSQAMTSPRCPPGPHLPSSKSAPR